MKSFFFALLMGLLAAPAVADEVFQCQLDETATNGGWLPQIVVASVSSEGATATVNDPIILHFNKTPLEAKIVADNDKRLTLSWRLKVKNNQNQYANFAYRLTILKSELRAIMSAQPLPFDNQFNAEGRCERVKG